MKKFLSKMSKERNVLECIFESIPGYRGYKEKERRREADKSLREFVVAQILELRQKILNSLSEKEDRNLALLGRADRIVRKIEKVSDRIRLGNYGYSGFFDQVKVGTKQLNRLYEFDYNLLSRVENIRTQIDNLKADFSIDNLNTFEQLIDDIDALSNDRSDLLFGPSSHKE